MVGPGGQGKTRLARHLATEMSAGGWAALTLAEQASAEAIGVLADVQVPTLVIVGYAEARATQLDALIAAMDRAEAKVRLLLLARSAGAWRTDRVDPSPRLPTPRRQPHRRAPHPLEPTTDGRQQAWREAITALAPHLRQLEDYTHLDRRADAARHRRPRRPRRARRVRGPRTRSAGSTAPRKASS